MNNYGFDFTAAYNMADVDCRQDRHYKFKSVDFLVRPKQGAKRLLMAFHGIARSANGSVQVPIFRGYNWDYASTSMLCMSDRLLELYVGKSALAWFLSTNKHDLRSIYRDIIGHVSTTLDVNEMIFFGTSGGGYPSIMFASMFKSRCVIANSQICLEKYGDHLARLMKAVAADEDVLVGTSMEEFLEKEGFPERMEVFQNKADAHHYLEHFLPFKRFCQSRAVETATFVEFDSPVQEEEGDPHGIAFPPGTWLTNYL